MVLAISAPPAASPASDCRGARKRDRRPAWLLLSLLTALPLCIGGCSDGVPRRYPVAGTVRFPNGDPVRTGTIEFCIPGSRWSASGQIQRDGTFELTTVRKGDGAIAGEHRVIIRQMIVAYHQPVGGHDHGRLVDTEYGSYSSSDLRATVQKGRNEFAFTVRELPASRQNRQAPAGSAR